MSLRLSDLLDHDVVDEDGNALGVVHEAHLVQDGPLVEGGIDHALRLHGLYVGRGGMARRLGYVRGVVRGPWILRMLLQHGAVRYVPWARVRDVGDRITVSGDGRDLGPTAPGDRR
jgi:sporulation protein YlmC with PRC-barrel domain